MLPEEKEQLEKLRNGTFGRFESNTNTNEITSEDFCLQSPEPMQNPNTKGTKLNSIELLAKRRTQALAILTKWKSNAVARNQKQAIDDCDHITKLIKDLMPWELPKGV